MSAPLESTASPANFVHPPSMAHLSSLRTWTHLVIFSFRRMAHMQQTVGIAIGLLLCTCLVTSLITSSLGWDRTEMRLKRSDPTVIPFVAGAMTAPVIEKSEYMESIRRESRPLAVFSRWLVFFVFLGFLLPLWNLCFATSALARIAKIGR